MNTTLAHLPRFVDGVDVRLTLFGRSRLYGGFYAQARPNGTWMEGKLFRTTYAIEQFQSYLRTCRALTKLATAFVEGGTVTSLGRYRYVTNLYEMVTEDAEPVFSEREYLGVLSSGDSINGRYSPDYSTAGISGNPSRTVVAAWATAAQIQASRDTLAGLAVTNTF
jgi:hypothetical protein